MMNVNVEAPWYTFLKKVQALFEGDPEIVVEPDLTELEGGNHDYALMIGVKNHEKYLALDRMMRKEHTFGNISVEVMLFDEENTANEENDRIELYRTIFKGNRIVRDVKEQTDFTGTKFGYVRFEPEVIQFDDDNTADYSGLWNGLAEDIAREVFVDEFCGVYFCTVDKRENAVAATAAE